jgi:osmotically-inducible protein OsmY
VKRTFMTMILLGLVLTSGCGSMLAKMGAEPIKEDLTKRSMGQSIEDTSIENKAIVNIHASDEGFKEARIDVDAYNGFVLITGQVSSGELKDTASQVVSKIPKVRRIYNELELASPTSLLTRTSDRLLRAEIKARLLAREDIQSSRVHVVVENGVVFLMGIAYRVEGERVITAVSDVSGVQRVVSLFEWLD